MTTVYDDNTNLAFPEPRIPVQPTYRLKWVFDSTGVEPSLVYTLGLASRPGRAYELATTGLPGPVAQAVIRSAVDQLDVEHLEPAEGLELDETLKDGYLVRLRRAADTSDCTEARVAYGDDVPVWQILIPDKWGYFPGDSHYAEADAQPLM
ncbi:DUF4262 domain-containing protein [Streptomyces microflavus]|uniref:DUF4262 domain-containing protein n=1 Tax=Streptomyces microflavus TaxID=1919 RepID=UPI0033EE383E